MASTIDREISLRAMESAQRPRCSACDAQTIPADSAREGGYFYCPGCHLVQVWPRPSEKDLASYYDQTYQVDRNNYLQRIKRDGADLLKLITARPGMKDLLEVGSSWGGFLALAKSRGFNVKGVEISPQAARWAQERENLDIHCGTLASSPFVGRGEFDLVVAWHVIEHLIDPLEFLRQARSCLRPGGLLALRTPNVASLVSRANGRAWEWFGAPTHLTLFSPQGLARITTRAGFCLETIRTRRGDAHNPWFELVRGTLLRAGFGAHIKKSLGWEDRGLQERQMQEECDGEARRVRTLSKMDAAFDGVLFFLYPAEYVLNLCGRGPELLYLGRFANNGEAL
jgi:SAM-dependent methyltransferase